MAQSDPGPRRKEVVIKRDRDRLKVGPVRTGGLLGLLAEWDELDEALPDVDQHLPPLKDVKL